MKNNLKLITNGIVKNNPLLSLMIGLCSTLAITTKFTSGLGMGVAMTFVLVMSETIISLFRKIIPEDIRIPIFIIVIAAFTTIVDLSMQAFTPALAESMGIFIPLIVVNCIIMGRVESFASKEPVGRSILDAIGMGIGYTLVLVTISIIREFLGTGSFIGQPILPEAYHIGFFSKAPGGFFVFGSLISLSLVLRNRTSNSKKGA